MDQAAIALITAYPWLSWAWFTATVAAIGIRAGWPEEKDRPRWVVVLLAIVDVCQFNPSGPIKLLFKPEPK